MNILIVDDDRDSRFVMGTYFRIRTDWQVTFAESGEDALFKYASMHGAGTPFDCVILDIAMPDMTGLKVAETIRATGDEVPILFCTAYDRAANRHGAEDVQAAGYLTKPITGAELQAEVERVVEGRAELPDGE